MKKSNRISFRKLIASLKGADSSLNDTIFLALAKQLTRMS